MDMIPQGTIAATLALTVFSAALLYAALRDVTRYTIPNGLVLWLAAAYALLAPLAGLGPRAMLFSLGVAAMVFFVTIAAFALGWMGGGDSKLMTVVALWIGPQALPQFLVATLVLGGLLAISIMTLRLLPDGAATLRSGWLLRLRAPDAGVPYGLPIGLAGLMTVSQTGWVTGF